MGNRVKSLVALGGSGLAGMAVAAFMLGTGALGQWGHRSDGSVDHSDVGSMCSDGANRSATAFYREMSRVNAHMHAGMEIAPSGNIDRDFARMMIPHHQGAIEMALVQLKYGRNERLRRLAQSIIIEQGQEIAYMRTLLEMATNQASTPGRIAAE
jgi:uncharacterized protein (DUF305 family)